MKKLLLSVAMGCLVTGTALAQTAEEMKSATLKACQLQAENMPDAQKEIVKKTCECGAENTDYKKILEYTKAGNVAGAQEESMKAAQKCAKHLYPN